MTQPTPKKTVEGLVDARGALSTHVDRTLAVQSGQIVPVPSGLTDLDKILSGGFQKSTLNVIGGVTGVGKTAALTTIFRNVAFANHTPLFVSLEQPTSQLITRLVADKTGASLDLFDIKDGLTHTDLQAWTAAIGELEKLKFFIDDTPGQTIDRVKNVTTKLYADEGVDIVFVDYLQIVRPEKMTRMRYLEIDETLQVLHELARELDIPIVMGAQLSRDIFRRSDKTPMLADLRESGNIEQYAYTVVFLHREDYWDPVTINRGTAQLIVAKHRQGKTGTAQAIFRGQYSRLENAALPHFTPPSTSAPQAPVATSI